MNTTEYEIIPIDKIIVPEWDIRKDTKDDILIITILLVWSNL
jgi:hypothetical protein